MKTSRILFLLFVCMVMLNQAQINNRPPKPFTREGIFDTVFDHLGNKYALKDLQLNSPSLKGAQPSGGGGKLGNTQVNAVPSQMCTAGYFNLYFKAGSYWDNNIPAQNLLCQLFTDISNFINSPLTMTNVKVNILCDDAGGGAAGTASSFYALPWNPLNSNQGIADNQIHKAIISGFDPFANLPTNVFSGANNFYYGYVNANPNVPWHLNMNTASIASTDFDLYTVMLHEVTHALGFASLISGTGFSKFGANNNYFSRFDRFLTTNNGAPLLSVNPSCPMSGLTYQASPTNIAPGGTCLPDWTNCALASRYMGPSGVNVPVYTPNCYSSGSSLSHFEDMCQTPGGFSPPCTVTPPNNNMYYVMCDALGSGNCYVKRHLTEEERLTLCDLGYDVNTNYSSPVAGAPFSYAGGVCQGPTIWGRHDGFNGSISNLTSTTNQRIINKAADVLPNDIYNGTNIQVRCVEVVFGTNVNSVINSPTSPNITVNMNGTGNGLVVLKYLPYHTTTGRYGTATYIYVFFIPTGCTPPDPCNIVQNGGFESLTSTSGEQCAWIKDSWMGGTTGVDPSCWATYDGEDADFFTRNCSTTNGSTLFNLGTNTYGTVPAINSFNQAIGNTRVMGLAASIQLNYNEAVKNSLSAPLQVGVTYEISFWVKNHSGPFTFAPNPGGGNFNPNATPVVIQVCSAPNFAVIGTGFPAGNPSLNNIASLQVPATTNGAWKHVSQQFVFNSSTGNHNAIVMGIDVGQSVAAGATWDDYYCFIDEVQIRIMPNPTFILPQPTICQGSSILNLAQYASPVPGTFAGTGVTQTGGVFNFNSPATLPVGSYPISFNFVGTNGCPQTVWQNVSIVPATPITITGPGVVCSNNPGNIQLNASSSPGPDPQQTFTWTPGGPVGAVLSIPTPQQSGNYVVQAMIGGCMNQASYQLTVINNCCPPIQGAIVNNGTNLNNGTTLSGIHVINQSITFNGASGWVSFTNGEFVMAPGVQITVPPNWQMEMKGAHFYSCADMWQGIVVQNGGQIYNLTNNGNSNPSTLIEDAVEAINLSNVGAGHATPPIQLEEVIFNKNLVGIKIDNVMVPNLDLDIRSCVFTSRSIQSSGLNWPGATTSASDLRSAPGGIAMLTSPYPVGNFALSNLKAPFTSRWGYAGIMINSVNNMPGAPPTAGVDIGKAYLNWGTDFNLFDALSYGFDVTDASLTTLANVFQEMRCLTNFPGMLDGMGIRHQVNSQMNARLDLAPVMNQIDQFGMGNHFWNCFKGVEARDVYEINIERGIYRSKQNVGSIAQYLPGHKGIDILTNRFKYNIRLNQFNNINDGIVMNTQAGPYFVVAPQFGVYADRCYLNDNYFGPQLTSNTAVNGQYLNNAITVHGPNGNNTTMAGMMQIWSNKIDRAYRGISIHEMDDYPIDASGNRILLDDDNSTGAQQYGIEVVRTRGNISVIENTLTCTGWANQRAVLVYCELNGGIASPLISCNRLYDCFRGFEFYDNNAGTIWKSNQMTNLERGLCLSWYAIINTQGGPGNPIDNEWLGTTWNGPGHHTYVDAWSNAGSSPLYLNTGGTTWPTQNFGTTGFDYNTPGNLQNSNGGNNLCNLQGSYPQVPSYRTADIKQHDAEVGFSTSFYPNPTSGRLVIEGTKANGSMKLKVQDLSGKLLVDEEVHTTGTASEVALDLIPGMYFISIDVDGGSGTGYRKLVIEK